MTRTRRAAAPLLGVVIAAALLVATRDLDHGVPEGQLGPAAWPRFVLCALALTCLVRTIAALRARPDAVHSPDIEGPAPLSRATLATAAALILLYVAAAPVLGFPIATAAFIVAFMRVCGARLAPSVASAALGTVGLLYLFVKAVYLPLPKGDGPFERLTLALYRALHIF